MLLSRRPAAGCWHTEFHATNDPFFPHISAEDVQQIAVASTPEELRTRPEKIHLLPMDLAELFEASITPAARLALLLTPVFDPGIEDARLVRATDEHSHRMLMESYAGLHSKG